MDLDVSDYPNRVAQQGRRSIRWGSRQPIFCLDPILRDLKYIFVACINPLSPQGSLPNSPPRPPNVYSMRGRTSSDPFTQVRPRCHHCFPDFVLTAFLSQPTSQSVNADANTLESQLKFLKAPRCEVQAIMDGDHGNNIQRILRSLTEVGVSLSC